MRVGPMTVGTIHDWAPEAGSVVSWHPSPATRAKVEQAPVSGVPVSYMQAQHLRGYREQVAQGLDYSRLLIATCDVMGRCDIRTMTYLMNEHLRRHDTYRSWFEYSTATEGTKDLVRHTLADPADIEFVPTEHGEMTAADVRNLVLATPNPFQWDCFSFGIVQGTDHFALYTCVDHLHMDATFASVLVTEFYLMYAALVGGGAPVPLPAAGSYDDYCVRQHRDVSALTADSPQVRPWLEFAEHNAGSLPEFPLPLGDPAAPSKGGMLTEQLLDDQQTARFESACVDAGARFIGGVFACAAIAECGLTGAATYYGLTPIDTRATPEEFATVGWFTGLVPITVPVGEASFAEIASAAQISFDTGTDLAQVPWDRIVELAPSLTGPGPNFPVVNYIDGGVAPFSGAFTSLLEGLNLGLWYDGRYSYQFCIFVYRMEKETAMTVLFPDNPVARESVTRYLQLMKSHYVRVAEGKDAVGVR